MLDYAALATAGIPRGAPGPPHRSRRGCRATSRSSWTATGAGPSSATCRASRATAPASRRCATPSRPPPGSGLGVLTLYAFSVENWKRPRYEVWTLMNLLKEYMRRELETLVRNDIRFQVLGRMEELDASVVRELEARARRPPPHCRGMVFNIALNYSGRCEIVDACRRIVADWAAGKRADIDEETIGRYLYTAGQPDPDLLIRTSGELRVSNFLLWQIAYSEIWVTPTLWPDFRTPRPVRGDPRVPGARPPLRRRRDEAVRSEQARASARPTTADAMKRLRHRRGRRAAGAGGGLPAPGAVVLPALRGPDRLGSARVRAPAAPGARPARRSGWCRRPRRWRRSLLVLALGDGTQLAGPERWLVGGRGRAAARRRRRGAVRCARRWPRCWRRSASWPSASLTSRCPSPASTGCSSTTPGWSSCSAPSSGWATPRRSTSAAIWGAASWRRW